MFSKPFWIASFERATKSAAQAIIGVIGQDAIGIDLFDVNLTNTAGTAAGAALLSLLTSIVSSQWGDSPSPSLTPEAEVEVAALEHPVA